MLINTRMDPDGGELTHSCTGAGGKGAPERTDLIDRDAASHFVRAAAGAPGVARFLMISYIDSRRARPAWWDDAAWADAVTANGKMGRYAEAKIAADEVLVRAARDRGDWAAVCLRPGWLSDEPEGGVELGRTAQSRGGASRATVARVAELLLAKEGLGSCWLDLLDGAEEPGTAVDRVVREGVDAVEGEPVTMEK